MMISVLMAVYNGERYLRECVESVLQQTYKDFEFIIIDDGSTDTTPEILDTYSSIDDRIRVVKQHNLGLTRSLNLGVKISQGEFIARMDADDVCESNRLEMQLAFMRTSSNSNVAAVGSWVKLIDHEGKIDGTWMPPINQTRIFWSLIFFCPLPHPAVLIRKIALQAVNGYDESIPHAQDYDLWSRMVQAGYDLANLPELLLRYRAHESQISQKLRGGQDMYSTGVALRHVDWLLNFNADPSLLADVTRIFKRSSEPINISKLSQTYRIILEIINSVAHSTQGAEVKELQSTVARRLNHRARCLLTSHPFASIRLATWAARMQLQRLTTNYRPALEG